MQEIVLCRLEKWIGESPPERKTAPEIIVGPPCDKLRELQAAGYCVLAELAHLQGMSEEAVAEALCKEEAVTQFENVCIHAVRLPQAYLRRIWCKTQGQPVLIAETGRLLIRESMEEDAAAFLELYQDAECRKYLEALPVMVDAQRVIGQNGFEQKGRGWQGDVSKDNRFQLLEAYQRYITEYREGQYAFYEYGMWTLMEKDSGIVVGRAGLELQKVVKGNREGLSEQVPATEGSAAVGRVACEAEDTYISLGYALLPQFRGKGYAVEACLAILEYCKECGYADRVVVKIDAENEASRKVFAKIRKSACMALELINM